MLNVHLVMYGLSLVCTTMSLDGPKWTTCLIFGQSTPIPKAIAYITIRECESRIVNEVKIDSFTLLSMTLVNMSTTPYLEMLGVPGGSVNDDPSFSRKKQVHVSTVRVSMAIDDHA